MKRCVIVGAAGIGNYEKIKKSFREDDFLIYCDGGLRHRKALGREPDLVVGDFDSSEKPDFKVETILLPHNKDDTDTVAAVREAVKRGFQDFLLIGVTGGRIDHTLGNLSILLMLDSAELKGTIVDDYSEMSIISYEPVTVEGPCKYFSLLNISGIAEGVTIRNALYNLEGGAISCEYPIGISNELVAGQPAEVTVGRGRLLLIKVTEDC